MVIAILIVLGLCLGSFVNALVWRLHEQERLVDKVDKDDPSLEALSIVRGHSMCSYCHHRLATKDLIPVFSWLSLRGKCRYCNHVIEDNPLSEIIMPILFVLSYIYWPVSLHGLGLMQFCFWVLFVVGFVALTIYDTRWYLLPDKIVFPLIFLVIVEVIIHIVFFKGGTGVLVSEFWGVIISSGLFFVLFQFSKGQWIGGGDVKLGLLLGLILGGPANSLMLLFLSSALGSLISIPLLIRGKVKRDTMIPYGPFLLAAAFIITLFGDQVMHWINGLILS